jgi:hypothetical protein
VNPAEIPTVELLTRAADAAGNIAEQMSQRQVPSRGWSEVDRRWLAASGPDHWRAVEATFRRVVERHQPYGDVFADQCRDCFAEHPCPTLKDLRDLAEQVLQHLGDTE